MNSQVIRNKFLNYFAINKLKHGIVDSSSLWPHDDPSVLLTTAGMQQFKLFFLGQKDPQTVYNSRRLTSIQKCFRTSDIEEVGDYWHNTFFEMLGNFSIGDYFKEEAIKLAWNFLNKRLHISKKHFWVTYFAGDQNLAKDDETLKIWSKIIPVERIVGFGKNENWWGPPGPSGPCGPCSEIHYDFTLQSCSKGDACLPNCDCGRFMELWNLVFMQFNLNEKGKLTELPTKNIDTGMGLERLALILQNKKNIYETDLFEPLMNVILHDPIFGSLNPVEDTLRARIVADHIKASVFLLSDGIIFNNKEQGYILRRIFRRALDQYLFPKINIEKLVQKVIDIYSHDYPLLLKRSESIHTHCQREFAGYQKIIEIDIDATVKKIKNIRANYQKSGTATPSTRALTPEETFNLYSTYGISTERLVRQGFSFDRSLFMKLVAQHQSTSRAGAEKKFGGHGLNSSNASKTEKDLMTRLHTATHLLQQALRDVLGPHIKQQGSDINVNRLRFDFEHPAKLTDIEKEKIEKIINEKIQAGLTVTKTEMGYEEAMRSGALSFFKEKYPEVVTVYSVGDYSKELCGGPHVTNTNQLGTFKIISEKSSSAGIRRIKATIR